MKKILLNLFLLLMFAVGAFAQVEVEEVEIGDSTSTSSSYSLPVNMYFNYSLTQQIYTAEEIGMAGFISAISFDYVNESSFTMSGIKVYMMNTDKTSFENDTDMVAISGATLVYDGDFSADGAGWITITLDTPFEHNGTDNLLICVYDQTNGYPGSSYKFKYTSTTENSAITYYSDSYVPNIDDLTSFSGNKHVYQYRSNIKLEITTTGVSCATPSGLTVSNVAASTATLSWTAGDSETAWQICINNDEDALIDVDANQYTITGLNSDTDYTVRIRAICGGDDGSSAWTANTTLHTLPSCYVPTALEASNVTATTATLTWVAGASEESWILQYGMDNTFADGSYTEVTLSTTSADLTGLIAEAIYYARVKAKCSEDDMSHWSSVCLFYPSAAFTIGTADTTIGSLPTYILYNYSLTQQIYLADEIGTSGTITSVAFFSRGGNTRNVDVYMVATDKTSFESVTDWITVSENDKVFSGDVSFVAYTWTAITLDTPFEYDGTSNLAIIVDDNTGTWTSSIYFNSYAAERQAIRIYNDNTNYDPESPSEYSGTIMAFKNQIRLFITNLPSCTRPSALQASNVAPRSADLTWNANGDEAAWQICLNGDESNLIDVTATNYTLSNLTPETTYTVRVRAYCADDDQSLWSSMVTITTPPTCFMPSDLQASNVAPRSADLSWTSNGDEAAWQICLNDDETNLIDVTATNYTLENLTPETNYSVRVRAYCADDDQSAWSSSITFFTPEACPRPTNITVETSPVSAVVRWDGTSDSYIVRYREFAGQILFYEDFENGFPEGWSTIDADGDGYNWVPVSAANGVYHTSDVANGGYNSSADMMISGSYSNVTSSALTPDNWLIAPAIELPQDAQSINFRFYANAQDSGYATEHYGVYISTTVANDTAAFTLLWEETMDANGGSHRQGIWGEKNTDLTAYAGNTVYLAIRHFNVSDQFVLNVDDFSVTVSSSEWIEVNAQASPVVLTGLTPNTTYEYQIRGVCEDEEEDKWTAISTFTTMPEQAGFFTITAVASANGNITPSGVVTVAEGETQTFEIVANENCRIASVLVDGVEAIDSLVEGVYTFANVVADHTIYAVFIDANDIAEYTAGSLSIYPNPSNGMFSIDFYNIEGNATYQLIDARGAMIENRDINVMNGETKMFNHNLRSGNYFVRIIAGDKVYVEKIVVE